VKVNLKGQVASGYRVTDISVYPPIITVFSQNQQLVANLPGYVGTTEIALTGSKDDLDEQVDLNLPVGVSIVGEQGVQVHVSIASIESSLTLSNIPIEILGLPEGFQAEISPTKVDVIVSGPIPVLDKMTANDVHVVVNMSKAFLGVTQVEPVVELKLSDLKVQSILPSNIEITIKAKPTSPPIFPGSANNAINTPTPVQK
jgi:YbbR domain-containing protein